MNFDELYIKRCIDLAENASGNTFPNPLVGSVIVYNNEIIGEGYHSQAGKNHAEINALNSVKDKKLLKKSTLYVNLEPCSHWGKTPPCAEAIVKSEIPRVVVGTIDTTEKVAGKGIEIMKKGGIEVKTGILEQDSRWINRRFFTFNEKKRPYIILKWAQTADGFIDKIREKDAKPQPTWITGIQEKLIVHKWRTQEQAIIVGTNTALNDNPELTSRYWFGKNPLRLVIDKKNRIPKNYKIFDNSVNTIIFNENENNDENKKVILVKINIDFDILEQILLYLYKINIQSLIVEGGKKLLQSFIDKNLWDEARIFKGFVNFKNGLKAPEFNKELERIAHFEKSDLFFVKNN